MAGRWATATDFFGGRVYESYGPSPFFAEKADYILGRWPTAVGQKVLVVGCGPGAYLVEQLVNRGVNCYGIDAFAKDPNHGFVTIAPSPAIAARCILDADTTNNSDVSRIKGRDFADLRGNARFFLVITEDVLPCLTAQDAGVAVGIIQASTTNALHILTCNRNPDSPDPERDTSLGFNWLTQAAWRSLINAAGGSTHVCWNTETRTEF